MPNLKKKHKTSGQRVVRAQPGAPVATAHAAARMNGLRTEGELHAFLVEEVAVVFGAPLSLDDCACSAVAAAQEMIELIEQFNLERSAAQKATIRIGIATGDVVAGYTGTQQRATYTCIGDTVNLAARLEAHTKSVQHPILIDAATRQGLGAGVQLIALGDTQFKGKAAAEQVYAIALAQT